MRYIATFSGGKDSLDTIIWCLNNLEVHQWDIVFCDTDWEDELTYRHIDEIEAKTGKRIIRLKHAPFPITDEERAAIRSIFGGDNIFAEMVVHKGRFPSTKARFCTEELKTKPMIDYLLGTFYDVTVLQGVRADESFARKNLKENDDYFKFYFEPYKINKKGKPLYHSYAKKEIILRCNHYTTDVLRPILKKTANQVFDSIYANGFTPNPLYSKNLKRVGCFPCVMCAHEEAEAINEIRPLRITQISLLEELTNSTFFPPNYIPTRFCTKTAIVRVYLDDIKDSNPKLYMNAIETPEIEKFEDEEGDIYIVRKMKVPTIKDVIRYVSDNPNQKRLFEPVAGCISVYNICER